MPTPKRSMGTRCRNSAGEFQLAPGTTDALKGIGVVKGRKSKMGLPPAKSGWMENNAMFKVEGSKTVGARQLNIGLGRGKALELFNDSIWGSKTIGAVR